MKARVAIASVLYIIPLLLLQSSAREDTLFLFSNYSICFCAFLYLLMLASKKPAILFYCIGLGLISRSALIFFIPNLSDDYFRFIWDGNIWLQGVDPFSTTPDQIFMSDRKNWMNEIYQGLNSKCFYTVYPAICQYLSAFTTFIFPGSVKAVYILKSLFFLFEVASIYLLWKLIDHFKVERSNILLYVLNPLVLIEVIGNVHFNGVVAFFVLLMFYLLVRKRFVLSGIALALGISTRLTPLMIIPFLMFSLKPKNFLFVLFSCFPVVFLLHLPFLEYLPNIFESLKLYYGFFEFNASFYYLAKKIFVESNNYDLFWVVGKILPSITFITLVIMQFFLRDRTFGSFGNVILFSWFFYLLFSTTVHPWYLVIIIAASVFSKFRFSIMWSFVIFFTYVAYSFSPYLVIYELIFLEYLLILFVLIYEIIYIEGSKFALGAK